LVRKQLLEQAQRFPHVTAYGNQIHGAVGDGQDASLVGRVKDTDVIRKQAREPANAEATAVRMWSQRHGLVGRSYRPTFKGKFSDRPLLLNGPTEQRT
jgi:hypothetical protein